MTTTYSILRFVPDSAKGEAVNVGLVIGNTGTGECRLTLNADRRRLGVLADRRLVDAAIAYLHTLKRELEQPADGWRFSEDWLASWVRDAGNVLQLSQPAPVSVSNLEEAESLLSGDLLAHARAYSRQRRHTKASVKAELRRQYVENGLERGVDYVEKPTIQGPNHSETFDFAVTNGRAVQLAHTWSFRQRNLRDVVEAVKAWAWSVGDLRGGGGQGRANGREFEVPRRVDVEAAYIEPTTDDGRAALAEARHCFDEVGVRVVPAARVNAVASRAARELAHA